MPWPELRQSGKYWGIHKRYAGIKPCREASYRLAWSSLRREPWAREYYQRKRAEGKSHTTALRALSRAWLRLIYRRWINHTPDQRDTFLRAQAAHRVARARTVPILS